MKTVYLLEVLAGHFLEDEVIGAFFENINWDYS